MADWFVRPDTSHSATRDGKSFANAWGGWSEIVWGGAGIPAGDTLYVCGAHTYSAIIGVGAQVATVGARITVRGDYSVHPGSITFTSGAYYIDANRNYMTFTALTMTSGGDACISPGGAPSVGLWITDNTFSCGAQPAIKFRAFNSWAYEDTIISGNTFSGGNAPTLGGCIQWFVTAAVTTTIKRMTISNNTFSGNSARATILLRASYGSALETCNIEDLRVYGNTFQDCNGVALEVEALKTVSTKPVGANLGIKVYDNRILNQGEVATLGGGLAISGFELSTTAGFGANDIYNNWCSGLNGLTGFCNPLYGTYRIFNNYAENISTTGIDGCGVLPDHGCHDTVVFGNEFRDIHGDGAAAYSATGFGILILDASNITCYGNLIVNCKVGIGFGNKTSISSGISQSSNLFNNTFVNCADNGVYLVGGADNTANIVRNNIFTASIAVPAVQVDSAAWTGESYNCFSGFSAPVAHTLAASTKVADPQLDSDYRPVLADYIQAGVYLGGTDFYGKRFHNPPTLGGVDDITVTPRYMLKKAS